MSLSNNRKILKQRKPTPEAIAALLDMYAQNANIKKLIKTFDLDIRGAEIVDTTNFGDRNAASRDLLLSGQIQNQYTMNKKTEVTENNGSKFQNEIAEAPLKPFVKFANEGDKVEGFFFGEKSKVKNGEEASECFEIRIGEEMHLLPNNVTLNRKLENLCKIKEGKLKSGVEIEITYVGMIKVDGVANKMKSFKVMTA